MRILSRTEKLEKIVNLNLLMNQADDLNDLLNVILTETEHLFQVEGTSILLEDIHTKKLYFYIVTGRKKEILKTIQMDCGEGICGYVFDSGKILLENDPQNSKIFSDKVDKTSQFQTRNILCSPLEVGNKAIGVIELVNKIGSIFTEDDAEFLKAISSQISITLEKERLMEEKLQSERMATIGETIAGLSHYIKNILNGLRGGEYIINKNIEKVESEKIKVGWNIVQKNIEKISSLVLDMLQYSKDRKPEYEATDLNALIKDIIELLRDRLAEKNIRTDLRLDNTIGEIQIDPKGIHRSILNIVTNSIDAFQDEKNNEIFVETIRLKDSVLLNIGDNGCGIEPDVQKKLFAKYFSTKGSKGTGLGLPVTKKIIEEHKGKLEFRSKMRVGTTFTIRLPLCREKL